MQYRNLVSVRKFHLLIAILTIGTLLAQPLRAQSGGPSWTALTHQPGVAVNNCLLLTDGRVICQSLGSRNWLALTPTNTGSYVGGTWSSIAPMQAGYAPLYFSSAVLPDGRIIVMGGEYECTSGCTAVWQKNGSIYNPATNTWTPVAGPSTWTTIGDAMAIVLADGSYMQSDCCSGKAAIFNPATLTWTPVAGAELDNYNNEEGWVLLPDGTVLTVDVWAANKNQAERFNPVTGQWASAGSTPVALGDNGSHINGTSLSYEIGAGNLRPDGTVFWLGSVGEPSATGHTAIFNPITNTWSAGPDIPNHEGANDAPSAVLPNGNVLAQLAPARNTDVFGSPSHFYEFDGSNLALAVSPTNCTPNCNFQSERGGMLLLPTGQVLLSEQSSHVEIYTPSGTPNPAWLPVITSVPGSIYPLGTYTISGMQFNGLGTGGSYGDDMQSATNYPLVRITNRSTGHVFYTKTHNHSSMGVATGNAIVSTMFDIPAGIETGPSDIEVVVNGIASAKTAIAVSPDFSISANPAALTLTQGTSGNSTVTLTALNGFSSSVTLDVAGCPSGATCSIASSVTPNPTATPMLNVSAGTAIPGTYTLTITGTSGTLVHSTTVSLTVNSGGITSVNVALASNNATASASSVYPLGNYGPAGAINGDRKGLQWGNNGGWNDGAGGVFPDWLEVDFNGPQTINEVDVFSVQDNYSAPIDPTPAMTFSLYGLRDFELQYWLSGAWVTIPGTTVTGNNLVWRKLTFAPVSTPKIRVYITATADGWSRVIELEAYSGTTSPPPDFSISANPAALTLTQGNPGNSTVTLTALNGFSSSVNLNVTGCPSGATCSIASSVTPNPTATPILNVSTGTASPGTYTLTITGTSGVLVRSTTVSLTINTAGATPVNVALASNIATAFASSVYPLGNYGPAGAINGDRKGLQWGNNGGWNNAAGGTFPEWLEVDFNGTQTINEADVFSVQDNYSAPSDPTPAMTFTLYGLRDFELQYWTSGGWVTIPGTSVTGNNLVWRKFTFAPISTPKIRVYITGTADGWSRVVELEAYSAVSSSPDFSISANPASLTLAQGNSGNSTVTVTAINGFSSSVNLDLTGCPAGGNCSLATSVMPSPTATPILNVMTGTASPGTYTLTITGTGGTLVHSATVMLTINSAGTPVNVALTSNGASALASSIYALGNYGPAGAINGDRKGLQWGNNGGWNNAAGGTFPEWLEVDFNGTQTINEVDVFSVQDNYSAPSDPTPTMTFSLYGLRDFELQYWTAGGWVTIPGTTVTGNNLVWRKFTFTPISTPKIRVYITATADGWSRVIELEAYTGTTSPSDFSISANTSSSATAPGGVVASTVIVTAMDGFSNSVDLTISGCPSGATCSIDTPVTPGPTATATITVLTDDSTSAGTYLLTITGTSGNSAHSTTVSLRVNPAAEPENVALATNGATVSASSVYAVGYGPMGAIDGDRKGLLWGSEGGWNDGTGSDFPDWIEVDFNGTETIHEVDVFSVQDNYSAPDEPTPTMTFSLYGLRDFEVQYWTGSAWATIPSATVTDNNLVWRKLTFAPISTPKIRVVVTATADGWSRAVELEAYSGME